MSCSNGLWFGRSAWRGGAEGELYGTTGADELVATPQGGVGSVAFGYKIVPHCKDGGLTLVVCGECLS